MNENLPKNAKRVFKGIIFDVYQWEQEMLDGSKATFEAISRPPTVDVITIVGDKILLNKEEQPFLGEFVDVQGGICDENEEPLFTAKRELLEETGYESNTWELYYSHPYIVKKLLWGHYIYVAKNAKKVTGQNLDNGGEKIEPLLVTFDEFLEIAEKKEFRNKTLRELLFRAKHTPGEIDKIKKLFFD